MSFLKTFKDMFVANKGFKDMTYEQGLSDLYDDNAGEALWKRAADFDYDQVMKGNKTYVGVQSSIYSTLCIFRGVTTKPSIDIAASNVMFGTYVAVKEADKAEPIVSAQAFLPLFEKWPELLPHTIGNAIEGQNEKALVFLLCAHLFGWSQATEGEVTEWLDKLMGLDEVKDEAVRLWIKEHI